MKTKTRIEIVDEDKNGMLEVLVQHIILDYGKPPREHKYAEDRFFIEEFLHQTGLDHIVEPRKQYRAIFKTQKDIRESIEKGAGNA